MIGSARKKHKHTTHIPACSDEQPGHKSPVRTANHIVYVLKDYDVAVGHKHVACARARRERQKAAESCDAATNGIIARLDTHAAVLVGGIMQAGVLANKNDVRPGLQGRPRCQSAASGIVCVRRVWPWKANDR